MPKSKEPDEVKSIFINPQPPRFNWRSLNRRRKISGLLLAVGISLLLLGVFSGVFGAAFRVFTSATVNFSLKDAQSKSTLEGVTIISDFGEAKTNAKGQARLRLAAGNRKIIFRIDDYLEQDIELSLRIGESLNREIFLVKTPLDSAVVSGTVKSADDGKQLSGVSVELLNSPVEVETKTDPAGRFTLKIPAGKQTLRFKLAGYHQKDQELEAIDKKTTIVEAYLNLE